MINGYVVHCTSPSKDGLDEWSKCFLTKDEALEYLNRDFFGGKDDIKFHLFELGKEIKLNKNISEVPQPSKKKIVFTIE